MTLLERGFALSTSVVAAIACQGASPASRSAPPSAPYDQEVETEIELVSAAVPWPRGIVWHDGTLYALARGVHRSAGGPHPDIDDRAGVIFEIDPTLAERVVPGEAPSEAVRTNGRAFAQPTDPPFRLWNRRMPAALDTRTDRPYAGLLYDEPSESFFILCFSGIDLVEKPTYRKNATDAIHRFHVPTATWYTVEWHDPATVPDDQLAKCLPNEAYPHSDPASALPPNGLPNGPCGGTIVGRFLYICAKDNSALIQYDLDEIRRDPSAGAPRGRYIFRRSGPDDDPFLETRRHGSLYVEGACAAAAHDGYLYVAFRTTSQVVRFPLDEEGDVVRPIVADYLAQFDPYDPDSTSYATPANLFDLRFNSRGECFVSCNSRGTVWKIPTDGSRVLDGTAGTSEKPYADLRQLTGLERSTSGNFCFDADDNLYVCTGNGVVPGSEIRGAIYRVRPPR